MDDDPVLTRTRRNALAGARRAVLATIGPDGGPRLVPICFTLDPARPVLYSPLDEKPKRAGVYDLARVRDILRDPRVSVLVDTWDEDWSQLAWTRCEGRASLLEPDGPHAPEHHAAVVALRSKYPQYSTHDLAGRPIIRIELVRATGWVASDEPPGQPAGP